MLQANKIAVIHVARQKTGMTELEYRDLLSSFRRPDGNPVQSSKELTSAQFAVIMDKFRALGFKDKDGRKHRKPVGSVSERVDAIRLDMGLSWAYVDSMARKASAGKIVRFQFLPDEYKYKVMQMLSMHQRRQKRKHKEAGNGQETA